MGNARTKIAYMLALMGMTMMAGTGCDRGGKSSAEEKSNAIKPAADEISLIAEEGYIYGLPIVMNYAVMNDYAVNKNSGQYKAPFNHIHNEARVYTYKDTSVVTPNSDTPYSMLAMDLRREPIVLSVPFVEKKRYYSVQLCDANTYNFGYIGSRATGNDPGDYLIVGPDWKGATPQGIKRVFRSSAHFASAIYRTQLFNAEDMPNVAKVQAGYKVQPLSAYLGAAPPKEVARIDFPSIDKTKMKTNFFEYLDFMLQFIPASPDEADLRAKLGKIGVGPLKTIDFKTLSKEQKGSIERGIAEGDKKINEYILNGVAKVNGWSITSPFGDRAFYNGNWLKRAASAQAGIYGNDAVEAVYPMIKTLEDGAELDGRKHKYALTFENGKFPPVNAFWSVTMYDGKTQLLIKNPINRYLINSPMLPSLKQNADGSTTLYIQKDSPGKEREANWLPAPDGPMYIVMRLYWPKTENPSILPAGQGSWKPPALKIAD